MDLNLLWTIQLSPLAAFLAIQLLPKAAKRAAPLVALGFALAAALSAVKLFTLHADGAKLPAQYVYEWLKVSEQTLSVGFLVDKLNLLMITVVTVITVFVQIFSYYYMAQDPSRPRYFGFLSFFAFAMTGLVLSTNLVQTFLFWELVGLASYMLIGFWYEKKSAGDAARKAFVLNRLADLGFYLGILMLFILFGSVNFLDLKAETLTAALPAHTLTALGLLVFMGVMGKSAQFPFHVWLPDAMEGPTPVSALIHSATMVAAGVFLLARAFGLFAASASTLLFILVIGMLTALVGASLAVIQRDIKRVMAYSTVSQLGLMVMGIGAGSAMAGMFHLTTHAFFKSLLFLTAGAFIHRFHTNDIWEIARGGGKRERLAMAALALGLFSLSGIFPFAGFFSKDMILEVLHERGLFFYYAGLFVSFLTAYYSFRLLFILTRTKPHGHDSAANASADGHEHSHGAHGSVLLDLAGSVPLVFLAVISVVAGLTGTSVFNFALIHWLGGHEPHLNMEILVTTTGLILAAAVIAFVKFKDPQLAEKRLVSAKSPLHKALENKLYIDDAYAFLVKRVGLGLAFLLDKFDRAFVNNVLVNGTSYFILDIGRWLSRLQSGLLQDYLAWALTAGVAILFWAMQLAGKGAS
jgi:NADH-quinone oxidoreductase subunit L